MRYTTRGMSVLDRLEKKSTDVGECREWSGYTNAAGYGVSESRLSQLKKEALNV